MIVKVRRDRSGKFPLSNYEVCCPKEKTLFLLLLEFEQNVRNTVCLYIQNIHPGDKTIKRCHFFIKLYGMKRVVKQVLGIDVAQKELVVSAGRKHEDLSDELYATKTFANNHKGFSALLLWIRQRSSADVEVRYVMEATGVYHEQLAHYLSDQGKEVSIVLPNKISNYMRTLDVKTVTDKTAADAIAQFSLERKLDKWTKPKVIYRDMRQLTRERDQIVQERTLVKNQLHAEEAGAFPHASSVQRTKERIKLLDKQDKAVQKEIDDLINKDREIKSKVDIICTVPGLGKLTAAIILAETNGFDLIRNRRQLASYAGFDVKEKQSGTSVKGKPRISKKGNKYLRKALHMPALAAIRSDERSKSIFSRLVSKHGIKMKAAVAVQRRLLEMSFTLFKTQTVYDKEHLIKQTQQGEQVQNQRSGQ